MHYINLKTIHHATETIDQFDSYMEAFAAVKEYRLADSSGCYYISQRATECWYQSNQQPAKVYRIYDNGYKSPMRYTVVLTDKNNGHHACIMADSEPRTITQEAQCKPGAHLGRRISWDDLPAQIQQAVAEQGVK